MVYSIVAYGDTVLRKKAEEITKDYPELDKFIANMFDTMYDSSGVGLAAPQVGKSIRVFIVDGEPFAEDDEAMIGFKKVFINPVMIDETGDKWAFNEGCLSIPRIREDIDRHPNITLRYFDENWVEHTEKFDGIKARIIQHEYDHLEGILFIDKLSPLKRKLLQGKLNDISKGKVRTDYRMRFPKLK